MDPRAHKSFNQATAIIPERVADFFVNPQAFKAFLETLDVANSNSANAALAKRQRETQQAMLDAARAEEAAKNNWAPLTLPSLEWAPMAVQQQQGAGALLPRDEAEAIRQDQYARQVAMLAQARLTP